MNKVFTIYTVPIDQKFSGSFQIIMYIGLVFIPEKRIVHHAPPPLKFISMDIGQLQTESKCIAKLNSC